MRIGAPVVVLLFVFGAMAAGAEDLDLTDEKVKLSYSIGYQVGGDFKRQDLDINPELLLRGIEDAVNGRDPLMSSDDMRTTLVDLKRRAAAALEKKTEAAASANLVAGREFLSANGKREGVVTRPSGLQYTVVREGSGKSPAPGDTVTVHYRGTLIDGTEFDSSYSRGNPATFASNRVIAGWQEALGLMAEGAIWRLFVPADLAYGERGAGSKIGPNSVLVFEVELLSVAAAK